MKDNANWCEKRNALSERELTAFMLFGALSAYLGLAYRAAGGGGVSWAFNCTWEISCFKCAAKFTSENLGANKSTARS